MDNEKLIATNKTAYHNYFIEDKYEAGIVLEGSEVKSIRLGKVNLKDSYITIKGNEAFILNMHISPYEKGSFFNPEPLRTRKLLLNAKEIDKLRGKVQTKGYTMVATKMYFKGSLVKLEIALAKGKELFDKRKSAAEKDAKKEIERESKRYRIR